jgi:hypothetical protein
MKRFSLALVVLGLMALAPAVAHAGCFAGYPYYSYTPVYQVPVYQQPVMVVPDPVLVPAPVIVPQWYHHHHHPGYYYGPRAGVYYRGPHVSVGVGF